MKEIPTVARSPAHKELLESILRKFDNNLKMTLADAYDARARSTNGWSEFVNAFNYLKSEGFLESKGDGFVLLYSLTKKGNEAIREKT
jgi:hypothetical protein